MPVDPLRIAVFRFEYLNYILNKNLNRSERRRLMIALSKQEIIFPNGNISRISLRTLYRWYAAYKKDNEINSLKPKPRLLKQNPDSRQIKKEWIDYALALIEEENDRSIYMLSNRIQLRFDLETAPSKSSLYRALIKEVRYLSAMKTKKGQRKIRHFFESKYIHEIWYADGKGKFKVNFADGKEAYISVLTILEGKSRFVLRALIIKSESIHAIIKTFREAAARYGLPDSFYLDRASAYDSAIFRKGLAILGIKRINCKPRDPEVRGKIEAYHRTLQLWFVNELKHQLVRDIDHLQELLDACLDLLYHTHIHKTLKIPVREAFNNTVSQRTVSLEQLREAFLEHKYYCVNAKTNTVNIKGIIFKIPRAQIFHKKIKVFYDPLYPDSPYIFSNNKQSIVLEPAIKRHISDTGKEPFKKQEEPIGSLSQLLEKYRNQNLPKAVSGFGLPEIYNIFSNTLNRPVPETIIEANMIIEWLKKYGPFEPNNFNHILNQVMQKLGQGRPLSQIICEITKYHSK